MKQFISFCLIGITLCASCNRDKSVNPENGGAITGAERWTLSENLRIAVHSGESGSTCLTSGHNDFKPSRSLDGSQLTFFRIVQWGQGFENWRTKICVINSDGSGFHELTDGSHPDFNQTWTRDGSHRVVFNRYNTSGT